MPFSVFIGLFLLNFAGSGFDLYGVYEAWPEGSNSYGIYTETRSIFGPWGALKDQKKTYISYDVIPGFYYTLGDFTFSAGLPYRGDKRLGEKQKFVERRCFADPILSLKYSKNYPSMAYGLRLSIEAPVFPRKTTHLRVLNNGTPNLEVGLLLDYYIKPNLSLHFNLTGYNYDIEESYSAASDLIKVGAGFHFHLGTHNPYVELNHIRFFTQDIIYHTPEELYGGPVLSISLGDEIMKSFLDLKLGATIFLLKREVNGVLAESTSVIPRESMSFSIDFKLAFGKRKETMPFERGEWIVEVRDPQGRGVKAKITVEPIDEVFETDEEGNLVIKDIPPGLYTLSIESKGYEGKRAYITVKPGARGRTRVTLNPVVKKRKLTLVVRDAETDGYIEAMVEIPGDTIVRIKGMGTLEVPERTDEIIIYAPGMRRAILNLTPEERYTVYLVPQDKSFLKFIVYFERRSTILQPHYLKLLDKIANILKTYKESRLLIEGHTCLEGGEKFSKLLSERRAEVVRDFFVETYEINIERIETAGYGDSRPIAPTKTELGRIKNRRVEINIIF